MDRQERLPLGVVVERRKIDNPWVDHAWKAVAVIAGARDMDPKGPWTELARGSSGGTADSQAKGEDWVHFHAGTLPLELFRKETEGYKVNLSQRPPRLFIVLRSGEDLDCDHDIAPFLVTACPYEAQDYLDSGEELVEPVAMPEGVAAFIQAFVDQHHVDEPFKKRKRKRYDSGETGFARRPIASRRGPRD